MAIRLETSKRNGIDNHQDTELSQFERNWERTLSNKFPQAKKRTDMSASYNCHGLTFAVRRTRIFQSRAIQTIIADDSYREVTLKDAMPGDVVVYYSEYGDPNHSGIVVDADPKLIAPVICSKWGNAGEYIHGITHCPTMYGPRFIIYRCDL